MNRKFALFIVIALLTSLVWVSSILAAPEAPTVSMEVCVSVEGGRSVGNDESVTYSLAKTSGGGGATYAGADTAAIQAAPTATACFDVVAEPGETYDLTVSGADTLSTTLSGVQINSGSSNDLTGSITLKEGDTNSDNLVGFTDLLAILDQYDAALVQPGATADLNEDTLVAFTDLLLLLNNYNLAGSRQAQRTDETSQSGRAPTGAAIIDEGLQEYATVSTGDLLDFTILIHNVGPENIAGANMYFTYDATKYTLNEGSVGAGDFAFVAGVNVTAGTPNLANISVGSFGVNQAEIIAASFTFTATVGADGDTNVLGKDVFTIIGGDPTLSDATQTGSVYGIGTNNQQFANCPISSPCQSPTAIALSSSVATPNQSVATIVLVFVASTLLVIGSRFAVLNKRK